MLQEIIMFHAILIAAAAAFTAVEATDFIAAKPARVKAEAKKKKQR